MTSSPAIIRQSRTDVNGDVSTIRGRPIAAHFGKSGMAGRTKNPAANHLRAWRERKGWSQKQLAQAAGTTPSIISEIESGHTQLSDKWAERLAPLLGTIPGYLRQFDPADMRVEFLEALENVPDERRSEAIEMLRILGRPRSA